MPNSQDADTNSQTRTQTTEETPNGGSNNRDAIYQAGQFSKVISSYELGSIPWNLYMSKFCVLARGYPLLTEEAKKHALYTKLEPKAFNIATPSHDPTIATWLQKTLKEYAASLGELFEPQIETDAAKFEYEHRSQAPGEEAIYYYKDKLNLYERAYPEAKREKETFFRHVIEGLLNRRMRDELCLIANLNADKLDYNNFRSYVQRAAVTVRRRVLNGDFTESEGIGAESIFCPTTYQTAGANSHSTHKGIHAMEEVNALNSDNTKLCYFCQSPDHFVAQCPRKKAGLPATVSYTGNRSNQYRNYQSANANFKPQMAYNKGQPRFRPWRNSGQNTQQVPQTYNNQAKFNQSKKYTQTQTRRYMKQRVMTLMEDDEGNLYTPEGNAILEQITEPENAERNEPEPESVNQVNSEDNLPSQESNDSTGFSTSEFLPGAFLGTN